MTTYVSSFTCNPTAGNAPVSVTFTDTSVATPFTPITAWHWNFGDTNISTLQNPNHTYNIPGTYKVVLTTHWGGIIKLSTFSIVVNTQILLPGANSSKMLIECSKNDGETFQLRRIVTLGQPGQYLYPRNITRRWGSARDFVLRFTITDPVPVLVARICALIRIAGKQ